MKIKTKVKGFMSFNAVLLCLVALMAGYSLLQIYGSQFSALSASRKALQAQQFAQSEADLLRNTSYDELDAAAHDRQSISGVNGWMSEVSIEAETTINEVPQRLATVKVYRNGTVTAPDFSLKVPLSSAYSSTAGGGFNTLVTITESCNWPAPVTGWYKFSIKGAGGGGGGASNSGGWSGGGGGEGGITIVYEHLNKGDYVSIIIGIGGSGSYSVGQNGNNSSISVNNNIYWGYGGTGGSYYNFGLGGDGDIPGAPGGVGSMFYKPQAIFGGSGGGNGGGNNASYGGGGSGGTLNTNGNQGPSACGKKGGDGVVWIEYFDPSKK